MPEFATLLGPGDLGDPLTAGVRAQLVASGALRAVASTRRPLVVFIDDLQWGGGVPLGFVDMVLSNEGSEGLLLVGAYREGHVDPSHPLAALLSRWREAAVPHIPLRDFDRPDLVTMLGEMLHVTPAVAAELGEVLEPHCQGNPYETVELLNALRRDGVLTATSDGWRWETAAVRAHLTRAEAGGLPASRVAAMPEQSRRAVEAMACLGGRAKLSVLEIAIAAPGRVPDILEPALRDGILVTESGAGEAVRFRHDRIREGVLSGLGPDRRAELHLAMARRLATVPDLFAVAAENSVQESLRAREGLLAGGDLANAGYTYHQTVVGLLDCGPTLDTCMAQVNAAQAFARRTGTGQTSQWLESYQWLSDVLRREGSAAAAEVIPADRYAGNPLVVIHVHLCRAIAAAIFGDPAEVARHGAVAVRLLPVVTGFSMSALAHPLYGLGLAGQARSADGDERAALLTELDDVLRWLGARAADAPDNFLHLLRLVETEQAWTMGDFRAAAFAFDSARREVERRQRPWHGALIAERAGHFYLAHGLEHTGYELLARAREQYLAWGAVAKAEQMEWAYPGLSPSADATVGEVGRAADHPRRATVTAGAIDLLGILSASRALSSETSVERLHARVVEVLSAMTGATDVQLVLWDEARQDWVLPVPAGGRGGLSPGEPAGDAGRDPAAPVSVLRYLRRTQEPLAVGDATSDDRFARDPYFDGVTCCSLLAVPVLGRGALRAVLLLENRLIRGAFTTGRLEAVGLIAGQLTVSLDNVQLYAGYRRIADEQAALRRVATLVARAEPPEAVFAAVAAEAGQLLAVDFAALIRYDEPDMMEVMGLWQTARGTVPTPVGDRLPLGGHNVTTLVHCTRRAARTDRSHSTGVIGQIANTESRYHSACGVPVSAESRLWGAMLVGSCATRSCRRIPRRGFPDSLSWCRPQSPTPRHGPKWPPRAPGSSPPPTRCASASSATCTTAPSSAWSRWRCGCATRRRTFRPSLASCAPSSATP